MDPPVKDIDRFPEKIEDEKEGGPSFHCGLYDTEVVHKIAQAFLPGLATACVDNTTGDIFRYPGSVAADIRKEMIEYLTHRSESFVAEHIVLEGGSEAEASNDPLDIISEFIDDFATSKRNLFSRVSGWLLSERREDHIDDFGQEMEINGFWLMDHREAIAQTLLKNVDFKNSFHCKLSFKTRGELDEHFGHCGYRSMDCENEGCTSVFCANQMENHDSVCLFKIIPCEQKCSESIMRREMDRHCITVCPKKLVNCPFYAIGCVSGVPQCELQQHRIDHLSSHLMYVLRGVYKKASIDDLKPRVEQIQQLSTRLAEARDARSLTHLVKDIDPKLGPLVMKPKEIKPKGEVNEGEKDTTDSVDDVSEETQKKALNSEADITGNVEDERLEMKISTDGSPEQTSGKTPEDDGKESEKGLADGLMEDSVKKDSEAENDVKEDCKLKTDEAQTRVPDADESKGSEVKVTDTFDEEGMETKNSTKSVSEESESETVPTMVMDKKDEEETHTIDSIKHASEESEIEALSTIVVQKADEEGIQMMNTSFHASEEPEIEALSTIVMEKAEEEGTRITKSSSHASEESETEAPHTVVVMEKADEEGIQTMNTSFHASEESEIEALSTIVMEKAEEEGTRITKSSSHASEESETEAPHTVVVMEKADEEGTQTMNSATHTSTEAETEVSPNNSNGQER